MPSPKAICSTKRPPQCAKSAATKTISPKTVPQSKWSRSSVGVIIKTWLDRCTKQESRHKSWLISISLGETCQGKTQPPRAWCRVAVSTRPLKTLRWTHSTSKSLSHLGRAFTATCRRIGTTPWTRIVAPFWIAIDRTNLSRPLLPRSTRSIEIKSWSPEPSSRKMKMRLSIRLRSIK